MAGTISRSCILLKLTTATGVSLGDRATRLRSLSGQLDATIMEQTAKQATNMNNEMHDLKNSRRVRHIIVAPPLSHSAVRPISGAAIAATLAASLRLSLAIRISLLWRVLQPPQ